LHINLIFNIKTLSGIKIKKDLLLFLFVKQKRASKSYLKSIISQQTLSTNNENNYEKVWNQVVTLFKIITSDNESSFADIYELLINITKVYFAYPNAFYECV